MSVMKKAWEIAKSGAKKHGGSSKDFFAESLRLAWALAKGVRGSVEVFFVDKAKNGKQYIEAVVGSFMVGEKTSVYFKGIDRVAGFLVEGAGTEFEVNGKMVQRFYGKKFR